MGLFDIATTSSAPATQERAICAPATTGELKQAAQLPTAARAKSAEKLRFVRAVQAAKSAAKLSDRDAVDLVAATQAIAYPTLRTSGKGGHSALTYVNYRRWSATVRSCPDDETAINALSDRYRRGEQAPKGDAVFWEYFNAFYLNLNKLPLTVAYDKARDKMLRERPGVIIPTIAQVRYAAGRIPLATLILAREGETACRNACVDYIERDWVDVAPGYCVIGDSRTFDTRVRVWDEAAQKWRACRPTVAALIDARSWYFSAWWITVDPVNTETLIRTMALHCANTAGRPPAVAYFDNGRDYCAQGFATPLTVDGHDHSIFRELGIQLVNATAYNGRAKTIERAFRDMMQQFDKQFSDYLGSRPGERNAAADWFDKHAEELPGLEQFCAMFSDYLDKYHSTPKHGKIHAGKSPAEIWAQRPDTPALSVEQLRFALLKPEGVRSVSRGPAVTWEGQRYYCDSTRVGDRVLLKSDPFDPTRIVLFTLDGALIGEARTRDAIKALALDSADARRAISALIGRQNHQLKEARTMLRDLTGGRAQISPLELELASIDAKPVRIGTRASVKGAAHTYVHRTMPGTIDPALPDPEPVQVLEFREDAEEAALARAHAAVTAPRRQSEEEAIDIAAAHNFLTRKHNNNQGDDDEY